MSNAILSSKASFAELVAAVTTLIDQLPTLLPNATILVNGTKLTIPQVIAQFRALIATIEALGSQRQQLTKTVATQKAERLLGRETFLALKAFVAANLGTDSPVYATLGFAPTKRAQPSPETKVKAAAKAKATRALRGIMGKRQRAAIPAAPEPVITTTEPTTPASPAVRTPTGTNH